MSLALESRSSSAPPIVTHIILGLIIPGVGLTTLVLSLYAYAAWKPVSRRYLDRVSFRLLTYALIAHICLGISFPRRRPQSSPWSTREQFSLLFSAGMFFSIAVNLPLVLAFKINGKKMEKYYVIGVTLVSLVSSLAAYASGNFGWDDVHKTCFYRSQDPSEMLRWLVGTQSAWILLASLGEVTAFIIIVGYLVVHKLVPEDTSSSYASSASHRPGSTIRRFRKIILRIGLYPIVSSILSISTTVIELYVLQRNKHGVASREKNRSLNLANLAIYAARPLIYGLLAATDPVRFEFHFTLLLFPRSWLAAKDPSFIRALNALRHPDNDSETQSQSRTPGLEMSTIIYLPKDEISMNDSEQDKDKDNTPESPSEVQRVQEGSTISTSDINPEMRTAQSQIDENGTGTSIDIMYHI
ncbi:hypothetical protein MSAN_01115000 [Mycena sanguinolenta]|uniref:Uncharacterized protein n=1 Tax=Mycena sanguinolenta TaxID=230812 RepID=A0A8H6YLE6_9AGAR|nr:hypothetical protein MSAN_01115000 [Mycena sanguinolenta]